MAIRVVVGEDNLLVREGIARLLAASPEVEVVAGCADRDEIVAAIESHDPDVLLTDIRMPPTSSDEGIRIAARLRQSHPRVGVVVLSQFADPAYVLALLESGSDRRAYLLKEHLHNRAELMAAVRAVADGGSYIDPKVVEVLVEARSRRQGSSLAELTPREREVLSRIAQGTSNAAIAQSLAVSKRAVERHINAIFLKLGLAAAEDVSARVKAALMFLAETDRERA